MFSRYSVKRPYTVLVGVILILVLGVVSYSKMTTDLLPDMSFPYALIITTDVGASPEKVEMEVTAPIEAKMATTSNIKSVSSTSYNSYSIVVLEYEQNANMDSVLIEIQQNLDQLKGNWGDTVGTPMIMQINPDMLPIMTAAVDVDGMTATEISNYVSTELTPALESVEGVASVTPVGNIEEHLQVTLNQDKIDAINEKIQEKIKSQFTEAQQGIDEGKQKIEDGQAAMQSGIDQMNQGKDQITTQKQELYTTKDDLTTKLEELKTQRDQLQKLYDAMGPFIQVNNYLESLVKEVPDQPSDEVNATIDEINEQIQNQVDKDALEQYLKEHGADEINEIIQQYIGSASAELISVEELRAKLDGLVAEQFAGLSQMGIEINGISDLPKAYETIAEYLAQMNVGISTIETALKQIDAGEIALNDAMDSLNYNAALGALQGSSASAQLATAQASLEEAQKTLDSSKESALDAADLNSILTLQTLSGLLTAQNFDMPAGYVNQGDEQYLIRVGDAIDSVESLENVVLMDMHMDGIDPIRLKDVADVEIKDNSDQTYAYVNGNPGIMLSMEKQTGYATGEVTNRLLKKFDALEKSDENLHMSVLMNQGVYIDMIVKNVIQNMIVGALLAVIVLWVFLKDFKPTIVIACSIPLSVVTAVVLMYFTGITLNIISMSGLALGIGMLVDNSIVVIENIYRLRGEGLSIRKASVEGANQVAGAIAASTLTTVSVYAPIVFTEGITRQLFVDMALTIVYTLGASLLVALTFVPAMGSAVLKKTKEINHPWYDKTRDAYGAFLEKCLRYKAIVFVVSIGLLVLSAVLALSRGFEFMDMSMEANQMVVTVSAKDDEKMTFQELTDASNEVVNRIQDIEGIETVGAMAGGNSTLSLMSASSSDSATIYVILSEKTKVSTKDVAKEIMSRTEDMDCLVDAQSSAMDLSSYFASGITVEIKGNDIDTLQNLAKQVAEVVENTNGTVDVDDGLDDAAPQLTVSVDKTKASEYGYTVAQVFQLIYAKMAESKSATTISTNLKDYEVFIQTQEQQDVTLDDIKNLSFTYKDRENNETEVFLKDICNFEEGTTLTNIYRDSQTRYIKVTAQIDEGYNVSLVSRDIQEGLKSVSMPDGYSVKMTGEDETIKEAMSQMLLMLLLAIVFIYLIMVAQFQSLLSPFIIMFTIPLAFTGGFLALFFSGNVVSIVSMLGFIMLAGLIVNNGIVLIDYINQARRSGESKKDAIIQAGRTRLRPIIMTALTTIISMTTMALGIGKGSEMMQPMAITMIGGLVYGTLLTLIVVPCIYDAFNKEKNMVDEEL